MIADTNRMLHELLEMDREQRAMAEQLRRESDERHSNWEADFATRHSPRLKEMGLPENIYEMPESEVHVLLEERRLKKRQELEAKVEKDRLYKEQVADELGAQTELLKRIAELLEGKWNST